MSMFDTDSLGVTDEPDEGNVAVVPVDSETETVWWGMTLITSRAAVLTAGVPVYDLREGVDSERRGEEHGDA